MDGTPDAAPDVTHTADRVSGYNATAWVKTLDDDFDPIYGDLGKVSIVGADNAGNFADDDDSYKCSADDGGSAATGRNGGDDNSTLCDASDVEIATSVTFPLGLGYGCDPIEVEYTLTCDWSSRGNRTNTVSTDALGPIVIGDDGTSNIDDFVKCSVE